MPAKANGIFLSTLDDIVKLKPPARRRKANGRGKRQNIVLFDVPVSKRRLGSLTSVLNRRLYRSLNLLYSPIPREALTGMRENYGEKLPKTIRLMSASLERGEPRRIAKSLGILDVLTSDALRTFGEKVTGLKLAPDPGVQVICYNAGDYSGPHNDHHPEEPHLRDGYVDIHIMLSEPTVQSQLLIYETQPGMLNTVAEVGHGMGVAVYRLPFWHYTTPVMAKPGLKNARRWLLLASYFIEQPERRKRKSRRAGG